MRAVLLRLLPSVKERNEKNEMARNVMKIVLFRIELSVFVVIKKIFQEKLFGILKKKIQQFRLIT
jgi:hypothetical protein